MGRPASPDGPSYQGLLTAPESPTWSEVSVDFYRER